MYQFLNTVHGCSWQRKCFKLIFLNIKFSCHPSAKEFIDKKMVISREKSISFYTKHIFTMNHTNSQRSNILNSLLKGGEYIPINDMVIQLFRAYLH